MYNALLNNMIVLLLNIFKINALIVVSANICNYKRIALFLAFFKIFCLDTRYTYR